MYMTKDAHGNEVDLRHGMHVAVTGSGSALVDPERGGATTTVIVDGEVLVFDCGRGVMEGLTRIGVDPTHVSRLLLTHLHFDHIASYGYFIISSWIAGRRDHLEVYGPPGTEDMSQNAIYGTHKVDVRFVEGIVEDWPSDVIGCPQFKPPVNVTDIGSGTVLETDLYKITAIPTYHYREHGILSLGYRVDSKYGSVVISGDGRPCPELIELAQDVDVFVSECAKPDGGMLTSGKFTNVSPDEEPHGGHTTPTWLGKMARDARAKKVIATHLGPFTSVPASRSMSKVYYGPDPVPAGFWDEFSARVTKNYSGEFFLAYDGLVVPVGN